MEYEQEIERLAEHFRTLGSDDPESWAGSQVREGIPQYARFVFLRTAWSRIIADGVSREDITESARVMQWSVLFDLAYQQSDPGVADYPDGVPRVDWTLFEVDEDGNPLHPIDCLHESVCDTDPSGRQMRPRGGGREG